MALLSIHTELGNIHKEAMIFEATRQFGMAPFVSLEIPAGKAKDFCYGDLCINENPDRPVSVSVSVEGAAKEKKKYILSTLIRDSAKLVLNFENGHVTVMAVKGSILARIGCVVKLRRAMAEIYEYIQEKLFNINNKNNP